MQSGISASSELHDAFSTFTSDSSLFALPITISSESLQPLATMPFVSSSFEASLPSLKEHVQPKKPMYLILRSSPSASSNNLIAVTYVPSTAPVRQKMLFAATRATLTRDLGLEKFSDNVFATDDFEVLDPAQWQTRAKNAAASKSGANTSILSTEERELQGVKRAEEEERHGTGGRDLMGAGGSGNRLAMKITDDARSALNTLADDGAVVILGIDLPTETLTLLSSSSAAQPQSFLESISSSQPSYAFYHYPDTKEVVFLYTCPTGAKVKERMMYASAKSGVLLVAQEQGVSVSKRLEASEVGEVGVERLMEEVGLKSATETTSSKGFAKPKRPGRR